MPATCAIIVIEPAAVMYGLAGLVALVIVQWLLAVRRV